MFLVFRKAVFGAICQHLFGIHPCHLGNNQRHECNHHVFFPCERFQHPFGIVGNQLLELAFSHRQRAIVPHCRGSYRFADVRGDAFIPNGFQHTFFRCLDFLRGGRIGFGNGLWFRFFLWFRGFFRNHNLFPLGEIVGIIHRGIIRRCVLGFEQWASLHAMQHPERPFVDFHFAARLCFHIALQCAIVLGATPKAGIIPHRLGALRAIILLPKHHVGVFGEYPFICSVHIK